MQPDGSTPEPLTPAVTLATTLAVPPQILSTLQRSWRVILVGAGLVILSIAQVLSTNDWFPLGSLSQYSYGRPLDAPTRSVRIVAMTEAGTERNVPLNPKGVGVGRAEIEGQLNRIIEHPEMLEGIARAWSGLHPSAPGYVSLRMERVTRYVENGVPTGESSVEVLTEWTVTGSYSNFEETK